MIGGMNGLYSKLRLLKRDIRQRNCEIFGNIFSKAAEAELNYSRKETAYDNDPTPENRAAFSLAQA